MYLKSSPIQLKAEPGGHVEGVAWSFGHSPDQVGDFVLGSAFRFDERLPMRLEHKSVIGQWEQLGVTQDALHVSGEIDRTTKAGREAAAKAAGGELSGLSIGFSGTFEKAGKHRIFTEANLEEVSLTARPANVGSRVTAVKALSECQSLCELEKSLKHGLSISRRQARALAQAAWPLFNEDDPQDLAGILSQFSLR